MFEVFAVGVVASLAAVAIWQGGGRIVRRVMDLLGPQPPICPGCRQAIRSRDPNLDCFIDGQERPWHWSCSKQVLSVYPGQPGEVKPEPPEG